MTTKTIKLSDHPHLLPGQACGHCNQVMPELPLCPSCRRPMDDWPQDAKRFLREHGWHESPQGGWLEPLADCQAPVTKDQLQTAADNLERCREYMKYKFVQRNEELLERTQARLAEFEAIHAGLLAAKEAGKPIDNRPRFAWPLEQAVRKELNRTRPYEMIPQTTEQPTYTDEQIRARERELTAADQGVLSRTHAEFIRKMKRQRQNVHHHMCNVCHRW